MYNDRYIKTPERNQVAIVQNAGYVNTLCYINRTGSTVYIKDRSGCITEIPPSTLGTASTYPYGCLVIQEINRTVTRNHENWKHQLHNFGSENCTRRHKERTKALPAEEVFIRGDVHSEITTFVVDLTGCGANPISRYIEDYDITVSAGGDYTHAVRSVHPGCLADQICSSATSYNPELDVYIKFRSIQNSNTRYSLWVIINGKIIELKPSTSAELRDGIYISYRDAVTGVPMAEYFESIHDERIAEEGYEFFTSYEAASCSLSDSVNESQKLKIEEMRLKVEAAALAAEKAKQDTEQQKRKMAEDAARHANAMRELEAARKRLEAELELRVLDQSRKNTTEIIKYVTSIFGFVLTMGSLILKK